MPADSTEGNGTSPDFGSRLDRLTDCLLEARTLGLLGPGPVERHLEHSGWFSVAVVEALGSVPDRVVDLGSGAGVPGLVMAISWPEAQFVLVEAGTRRVEHLRKTIGVCGLGERVTVERTRAEEAGREPSHRGHFPTVVARSFGKPSVTAECGAPFLSPGGVLVVSEPPSGDRVQDRWPVDGLRELGLDLEDVVEGAFRFAVLRQIVACPERYPRRVGMPAKRPLF